MANISTSEVRPRRRTSHNPAAQSLTNLSKITPNTSPRNAHAKRRDYTAQQLANARMCVFRLKENALDAFSLVGGGIQRGNSPGMDITSSHPKWVTHGCDSVARFVDARSFHRRLRGDFYRARIAGAGGCLAISHGLGRRNSHAACSTKSVININHHADAHSRARQFSRQLVRGLCAVRCRRAIAPAHSRLRRPPAE